MSFDDSNSSPGCDPHPPPLEKGPDGKLRIVSAKNPRPTIAELEEILKENAQHTVKVLPNGEVRAVKVGEKLDFAGIRSGLNPEIYEAADREYVKAIERWGIQNHSHAEWSLVLGEEVGECCNEALKVTFGKESPENLRKELLQVIVSAVAWIDCIDRTAISVQSV